MTSAAPAGPALSVVLPYWLDRPALEALEIARGADAAGYASLWAGEMMTFDAFALATAIARETSLRITVGPLAIGVRTPASLALGAASVAALGGRVCDLALGASTPLVVSGWHGRELNAPVAAMRETVAILRQLIAGERTSFGGRHVRSHGFRMAGALPADTTITIAAFGKNMLALAAELADRVVVNLVTPAQVARTRETIDRVARASGRSALPLAAWIPVAVCPGPAAWEQLVRQLVVYVGAAGYGEMFAEAGFGDVVALARSGVHPRDVAQAIPRELACSIGAIGTLPEVCQRLREYAAAGASEIGIVPVTADDNAGATLLPSLRRAMTNA